MWHDLARLNTAIGFVELLGGIVIAFCALGALVTLLSPKSSDRLRTARLHIAEGVLSGLSFKVTATLLKTLVLLSWNQIAAFAAVLALRTLLKRLFTWEAAKLSRIDGWELLRTLTAGNR